MTYEYKYKLKILPSALDQLNKLDKPIREALNKKLRERLDNPLVQKDKLRTAKLKDCYKIKLRSSGIRLIYVVEHNELVLVVVKIGKRENDQVYDEIKHTLDKIYKPE